MQINHLSTPAQHFNIYLIAAVNYITSILHLDNAMWPVMGTKLNPADKMKINIVGSCYYDDYDETGGWAGQLTIACTLNPTMSPLTTLRTLVPNVPMGNFLLRQWFETKMTTFLRLQNRNLPMITVTLNAHYIYLKLFQCPLFIWDCNNDVYNSKQCMYLFYLFFYVSS